MKMEFKGAGCDFLKSKYNLVKYDSELERNYSEAEVNFSTKSDCMFRL